MIAVPYSHTVKRIVDYTLKCLQSVHVELIHSRLEVMLDQVETRSLQYVTHV